MIINSLLDTDYYKFTMGQYIWEYYPGEVVTFSFTNRTTDVKLAEYINIEELQKEIFNVRNLKFTFNELQYLKELKIFDETYLRFLNELVLPAVYVNIENSQLKIETTGSWKEVTFWETFILSIVNELFYHSKPVNRQLIGENQANLSSSSIAYEELDYKIRVIQANPFKFSDFGTRRRFSHRWQGEVLYSLKDRLPNTSFLGTSNVYFAKKLDLKPIGTFAHEIPMVVCGLHPFNMIASHRKALEDWYKLYGKDLSIALTDTYGTDFFFKDGIDNPEIWKGLRQDSGCPFRFANKAWVFYKNKGINPREKLLIFSDGLDIDKVIKIEKEVKPYFKTAYGWGTNLTNDCGSKPLSLVMKATKVNGTPLVKLSDNLNKAIGDKKEIERYKKVFGYTNTFKDTPIY